jgi:hypothetical protein
VLAIRRGIRLKSVVTTLVGASEVGSPPRLVRRFWAGASHHGNISDNIVY